MKKCLLLAVALIGLASLVGCSAYDKPVFVEWGSSTTPFLIQLEGDAKQATVMTEDLLKKSMIGARRIQLTYRWQTMGRGWNNGKYIPMERLILVDRDPVTREWSAEQYRGTSTKNEAIWVESNDSVGFSTGIAITARIMNNEDAVKFLFNYPAGKVEKIETNNSYKDPYEVRKVSLVEVMDQEIRARVQKVFSEQAAVYKMDDLRGKKNEIMKVIETDVTKFFSERGITITTIGMFGGFKYENDEIQKSIDKVFQAQQDKNVAIAEAEAAKERKESLRLIGEGEAEKVKQKALGEAEAIKTVAEAKAFELQKLQENPEAYLSLKQLELQTKALEIWDGHYPVFLVSGDGGNAPNLLLTMPKMTDLPKPGPNANKAKHDAEKKAGMAPVAAEKEKK
jgi:regulator of protease activity HflC (stomatin/prohibitin superfamily)